MSDRFPRVSGKQMVRFLEARGFEIHRQTGSHAIMKKGVLRRPAVVPVHGGKDLLPHKVVNDCLETGGISREDFVEYFRKGGKKAKQREKPE